MVKKAVCLLLIPSVLGLILSCNREPDRVTIKKTEEPAIRYISPEKPPKIELRYSKGTYSWVIRADEPEKIIKADQKLRQYTSGILHPEKAK